MDTRFIVNADDLAFILKQIKIAEAHSGGISLTQAIQNAYGVSASDANLVPFGLRTVDGTYNNLVHPTYGAADQIFPRMTDPAYIISRNGGAIDFDGSGSASALSQGNYGQGGVVIDSDPRTISNLIVNQTISNPAAVAAWFANPLSLDAFHARYGAGAVPLRPGQTPANANEHVVDNLDLAIIPNQSPDIGLSPGFNAWMTFFGQFFDHGLDLVTKGGNGTVYIPLNADDPLITHGPDGIAGTGDEVPLNRAFMAVTRLQVDANGNGTNTTTAFVDQNQTYTSHPSHQVFLRAYDRIDIGGVTQTRSTGSLLDGSTASGSVDGAVANWAEVKAQALTMLGINLSDFDVHDVPLLATDAYGEMILGPNGFAQLVMAPDTAHTGQWLKEGNPDGSVTTVGAYKTGHAFLNDIAHHAVPGLYDSNGDHIPDTLQVADTLAGVGDDGDASTYDDEMLNSHFVTGDGRGNENIALSAVHSIFHSEHNRLVEANKDTILETAAGGDLSVLNEWLLVDVTALPADLSTLKWDGERLFQAARFVTEMQYQHLVFEEFARRIQPAVDPFVFTHSPDINAAIVAEFAHTVYRFGHSMLTDTVDRLTNNLTLLPGETDQATLVEAFLNPQMFVAGGANLDEIVGNIVRGATLDVGNAMDEFVVPALQNNLLGLPLDLAAINIARGRDAGIPSLNETRKQFYADYGLADVKPYTSWLDFAQHIKNPASIINFIAAYGTHSLIAAETTLEGKRAAAMAIVTGVSQTLLDSRVIAAPPASDRSDFLNAKGVYATTALGGMNNIDLWIGGLAEEVNEFGGMLGSTFNLVFEFQMEQLQNGDRFYYLSRTQGTNLLNQLEPNTFTDLVMRNTALGEDYATHLNGSLFVTPDFIFELDRGIAQADYNASDPTSSDPVHDDAFLQLIDPRVVRDYTGATTIVDPLTGVTHDVGGYIKYSGGEHVVLGGTEGNDTLIGDKGIDALWGDGGNDYLNAGMESDNVFGGNGDDIIIDPFGDDVLRGDAGNDVISAGSGLDLIFGGEGNDYILVGQDSKDAAGDEGDDFILGGTGNDFILGGEGNDWIEGGPGFDVIAGENSQLFFNSSIVGHDVAWGQGNDQDYDLESGDDIALSGPGIQRFEGMFGFDWAAAKYDAAGANFDFAIPIFTTITADILKDRFDQVEAASGWNFDDTLQGDDRGHKGGGSSAPDSVPTELFAEHLLTQEGINRIDGLNAWFGGFDGTDARQTLFGGASPVPGSTAVSTFRDGNILMGGDGNDFLRGRGGYDLLDGDAWLNVRIKIVHNGVTYSAESMNTDKTVAGIHAGLVFNVDTNGDTDFNSPAFAGRTLNELMLDGTINPGSLSIIREIKYDQTDNKNIDTAIFQGTFAEYEIEGSVDLTGDGDFNDANEFGSRRDLNADGDFLDANEDTSARDVNGDGFIYVRDRDTGAVGATIDGVTLSSRGLLTDDRDLLKNVEQLQFADKLVTIAGANAAATGTVTINDATPFDGLVTPYVGQVLTANLTNFADADGIPIDPGTGLPVGLNFEWQTTEFGSNSGWSTIQTSMTYTVRSVDPGHVLRAVAVFKDSNGVTERILSAGTDNPTAAFRVAENSASGTVVGLQIPFSVDYDSQSIGGAPPVDVDLTRLVHQIDPANTSGGRFTVVQNGVDFNGFPRYSIVVNQGGSAALNYEAPVHTAANQSFQFVDNQYQIVINSYSDTPANGGVLVAVRQFTILLDNVTGEPIDLVPTVDLNAFTTVAGQYADNFNGTLLAPSAANNSTGTSSWTSNWIETNDNGNIRTGQAQIDGTFGFNNDLRFVGGAGAAFDGAELTRTVNLAGATSATLSFDFDKNNIDVGESVAVQFSADGVTFQTIQTITNTANTIVDGNANGSITDVALTGPFSATSAIRFVASGINLAGEDIRFDNVVVNFSTQGAGSAGNNFTATFTEPGTAANGTPVAIASTSGIVDNLPGQLLYATVILTNAMANDVLSTLALPAGLTATTNTSVAGVITMTISGAASLATYQTAIDAVRFANTSQNPDTTPRVINVSVHDGVNASNVATATVNVVATNDAPVVGADSVITNFTTAQFAVPEWAFLVNDSDREGSILNITSTTGANSLTAVLNPAGDAILVTDTGAVAGGSFTNVVSDGGVSTNGAVTVARDVTGAVDGTTAANILIGNAAASTFIGGQGNDMIFANAGNDTITWNANANGATDGRDIVDGGADSDTYQVNGRAGTNETFRIYTRDAFLAINAAAVLAAGTEIIITRNGTDAASIITELDNIEEIGVNTLAVSANDGNGVVNSGVISGDTVEVYGDFNTTSLNFNTITIGGTAGSDTVNISGLTSEHRIVFNTNGAGDNVIGNLRPQDVVNTGGTSSSGTPPAGTPSVTTVTDAHPQNDIWAGRGANILTGTDGEDVFHFASMKAARGDTILSFEPGDKIDLSAIDAMSGVRGDQAFTLVTGGLHERGDLMVTEEMRDDGVYTVISGNARGDAGADFSISIKGSHDLTANDFNL